MLDQCIIHGFGYLGSRITGLIDGTRRVQSDWTPIRDLPFCIKAIVERDSARRAQARLAHPDIPCFDNIEPALTFAAGPTTFIKDFTSPSGRDGLLDAARRAGVPVLLEKPLSTPGLKVSLAGRENEASVNMSEVFNPVVRALAARLVQDAARIDSFAFVRANSVSLQRLRDSTYRRDIIGGAFVDKMIHDVHLLVSGAITEASNLTFGAAQVHEIAYDVLPASDRTELALVSLDGRPIASQDVTLASEPAEMMVDVTIPLSLGGRSIPTRWIASWCGIPEDLAQRIGVTDSHIDAARLVSAAPAGAIGRDAYRHSNIKLIVCNFVNHAGEDTQLICNIQARGHVTAWITERRNAAEQRFPIRFCVPVIESMRAFAKGFRQGRYLDLKAIEAADHTALALRAGFRAPLSGELNYERSLAILDANHREKDAATV